MTLPYGVLKCHITDWKITSLPHGVATQYHLNVLVDTGIEKQRIAINVGTSDPTDVMVYRSVEDFHHPFTDQLSRYPAGLYALYEIRALPALDFIRNEMSGNPIGFEKGDIGDDSGIGEPSRTLLAWLADARDTAADVYAFGRYWDDSQKVGEHASPKYWPEESGRGIHDIHMNQGSSGPAYTTRDDRRDHNETWQDGALLIRTDNGWRAFFSAFSGQALPTDNATGNPAPGAFTIWSKA